MVTTIRRWAEAHPFFFAPGFVGLATLLFLPGREFLGKGHWALLYLLVISMVASVVGTRPSFVAAVTSFFHMERLLSSPVQHVQGGRSEGLDFSRGFF